LIFGQSHKLFDLRQPECGKTAWISNYLDCPFGSDDYDG
jgi:hypothetical protein